MPENARSLHATALAGQLPGHGDTFVFGGVAFAGELSAADPDGVRWDETLAEGEQTEYVLIVARGALPSPRPRVHQSLTASATGQRHKIYGLEDVPGDPHLTYFLGRGYTP